MSKHHSPDEDVLAARSIGVALLSATHLLRAAGIETPELDASVLLAHVVGVPRTAVLAFPERTIAPEQAQVYAALVARRAVHEPVAYLIGHREFMGLDFLTDARALIPRPETELLVEAALKEIDARLGRGQMPTVADIGTGSGAIALSIAVLEPRLTSIYATDISAAALALAQENAKRLNVDERSIFLQGDLLSPLPRPLDMLLANLPYVAPLDSATLPEDVSRYEPALALFGAEDGLGHLRRLFQQAPHHLNSGATLLLECGYDQRAAVEQLARMTFPDGSFQSGSDYAGWDRYIIIHT